MKRACLLSLSLICSFGWGLKEYYSITRSARSLGMGGAIYALSDDEFSLFYNPSGVSVYNEDSQSMLAAQMHISSRGVPSLVTTLSKAIKGQYDASKAVDTLEEFQGTPIHLNPSILAYYLRRNLAVGLLIADTKVNAALIGKGVDSFLDLTAITDTGIFAATGLKMGCVENLHLGFSAKLLMRGGGRKTFSLLEIAKGGNMEVDLQQLGGAGLGIDWDAGVTYILKRPLIGLENRIGLSLNNILASGFGFFKLGNPPGLVRTISLGTSVLFEGWNFIDNFLVGADFAELHLGSETNSDLGARHGSTLKHLNFGVEMPIKGWLILRAGFRQGAITAGVGLITKFAKMDFVTYEEQIGYSLGHLTSRRFALRVAIGVGNSPRPAVASLSSIKKDDPSLKRGDPTGNQDTVPTLGNKPALENDKKWLKEEINVKP